VKWLTLALPFLRWLPQVRHTWRADAIAGTSVALVLVPQAMAYAQLAGVPAYYGLYAAFLPVAVAALWGSSAQLATGPVAAVSLLTASLLGALAAPGSAEFVALAIALALLVGLLQLALGVLRLGAIVNLLSHPVIVGFTSAAAIIIATSQLSKILGVPMPRSDSYFADIAAVLAQLPHAHGPTVAFGAGTMLALWALRRRWPRLPGVLLAVAAATAVSWAVGFERNLEAEVDRIAEPRLRELVERVTAAQQRLQRAEEDAAQRARQWAAARAGGGAGSLEEVAAHADLAIARLRAKQARRELAERETALQSVWVRRTLDAQGETAALVAAENVPADARLDPVEYRIRSVRGQMLRLQGGGEVVGAIPAGLPPLALPRISWEQALALASAAVVIALVGFMEAISIARAMAARTRQRIDANQELIGQGLANLASAASQGFPVSGSFSRSAVNLGAGAQTGASGVVTAALMLATLLFLTPLLYHLPQAVLAAVVIMAVLRLIDLRAIAHAWRASRHDGLAAAVTFAATLAFAPHLDLGILAGAGLAIALFVLRTMRPRVSWLVRGDDGRLQEAAGGRRPIEAAPGLLALRFDGQLYFGNVSYFEESVLEAAAALPRARHIVVVGDGINRIDASGAELVEHLVARLAAAGVTLQFYGLKPQVLEVLRAAGVLDTTGAPLLADDRTLARYGTAAPADEDGAPAPAREGA
jgi:SulP family sulfate permease